MFDDEAFDQAAFSTDAWDFGVFVEGVRRVVVRLRSLTAAVVTLTSRIWT